MNQLSMIKIESKKKNYDKMIYGLWSEITIWLSIKEWIILFDKKKKWIILFVGR